MDGSDGHTEAGLSHELGHAEDGNEGVFVEGVLGVFDC